MSQFDQYTGSSDSIISKAGSGLELVTNDFKAGNITQAEYDELCGNILDSNTIASQVSDMIRRQMVFDTFTELANIASLIASL